MRTLTTAEGKIYTSGVMPPPAVRVRVTDAGGTQRELTSLSGRDWLVDLELNSSVDSPVDEVRVTLKRQSYQDSLAPLREDVRFNLLTGSYAALIQPGRAIDIAVAIMPQSQSADSGDWRIIFEGDIEDVDASGDPFTFTARDPGVRLQNLFIETEGIYSSASSSSMEVTIQAVLKDAHGIAWTVATAKNLRDRVTPTTQNGYWYRATSVSGDQKTHATTEPTWPTTIGNTVVDNHVTWTCYGVCPTLYTPTSPAFTIARYLQKRESVMDAIKALAMTAGWEVRYRWRASSSHFELTLYAPDRSNTTADYTWDAGRYFDVSKHYIDRQNIRSAVQVVYSDPADLDVGGLPKRKTVRLEDAASMDKYTAGLPRFMEIAEAATSQITTSGQATALATAGLNDLKDPTLEQEIALPLFYAVELGDLLGFTADNILYTSDQKLAVTSYTHHLAAGEVPRTTVGVRGKPSLGARRWIQIEARPGSARPATLTGPDAPGTPTPATVQGGAAISFTPPVATVAGRYGAGLARPHTYELHISTANGFTPDGSSYVDRGDALRFDAGHLQPGVTYYTKVVPVDEKGNRGTASAQASFTAGYTAPAAMQPIVSFGALPPNSSFEAWTLGTSSPPDRWTANSGSWGSEWTRDTDSFSGTYAVKLSSGSTQRYVVSDYISVEANQGYFVQTRLKFSGLSGAVLGYLAIEWFDAIGSSLSVDSTSPSFLTTSYQEIHLNVTAPGTAKYAKIRAGRDTSTGSAAFFVDHVTLRDGLVIVDSGSFTYEHSWQNVSGNAVAIVKLIGGHVYWSGAMEAGTVALRAFSLDAGTRPVRDLVFAVDANGAHGQLQVKANGDVTLLAGSNSAVSLANVHYYTT